MAELVELISPIDGSVFAEREYSADTAIEGALVRARAAGAKWRLTPISERVAALGRFVDALAAMNDEIVPELAHMMGRPVRYGGEKGGVIERATHMMGIAEAALAPVMRDGPPGFKRYITHEPVGIVLVIAPWNYPYMTAINTIVPALLAGNSVLLKHASQTLLVGERLAAAFEQADLPKGLFANLVLSHAQTATLLASGGIDHINFTGSVEGGRRVEKAAAGTFATLGLELGGKDPAYVRADADIEFAVENITDGAFYNSGQSCCGVERVYAHADVYDEVVEGIIAATKKHVVGNPLDEATTLGPMAHARFADPIREQIAEAKRKGAQTNINMKVANDRPGSPYLAPEVLTGVNHQMSVMREESFGPVVGIMKVRDDAEAIDLMNDSPYGLTASIWTSDMDEGAQIGAQIETGTVFLNRCDYLDPDLVWTGVKDTGKGAGLSEFGLIGLTRFKSYHFRAHKKQGG
jgi:acyl-CoA reductase-like NAD-dependent aldehyde dehydrogenase